MSLFAAPRLFCRGAIFCELRLEAVRIAAGALDNRGNRSHHQTH